MTMVTAAICNLSTCIFPQIQQDWDKVCYWQVMFYRDMNTKFMNTDLSIWKEIQGWAPVSILLTDPY